MALPVAIDANPRVFQYRIFNKVFYLDEKVFKFETVSSLLCSFCNLQSFTVAIKQNFFVLNSKSH